MLYVSGETSGGSGSRIRHWIQSKPLQFAITTIIAVTALVPAFILAFRDTPAPVVISDSNVYIPAVNGAPGQVVPPETKGCEESEENQPGWGPARPTVAGPLTLDWPSLNADRENPDYGDERSFFLVKPLENEAPGGWATKIEDLQVGQRFLMRAYIHNSGAAGDYAIARDVKIAVSLPNCSSRRISAYAFLESSTAFPSSVWSGVTLASTTPFAVSYVPDTARLFTNANPNPGISIPGTDFLSATGQLIGQNLDGVVRGGYADTAILTFAVEIVNPA